jgi:hypothetical protein
VTRSPKNVVASILARLRNVAEDAKLSFNDVLQSYVNERFLARLARSPHAGTVLLKGALMLPVWGVPRARPTMDIDLLRRGTAEQAVLVQLVEQCAAIDDPCDGVTFEPNTLSAEPIRDATEYVGTRIRLRARASATCGRVCRSTLASATLSILNPRSSVTQYSWLAPPCA